MALWVQKLLKKKLSKPVSGYFKTVKEKRKKKFLLPLNRGGGALGGEGLSGKAITKKKLRLPLPPVSFPANLLWSLLRVYVSENVESIIKRGGRGAGPAGAWVVGTFAQNFVQE